MMNEGDCEGGCDDCEKEVEKGANSEVKRNEVKGGCGDGDCCEGEKGKRNERRKEVGCLFS